MPVGCVPPDYWPHREGVWLLRGVFLLRGSGVCLAHGIVGRHTPLWTEWQKLAGKNTNCCCRVFGHPGNLMILRQSVNTMVYEVLNLITRQSLIILLHMKTPDRLIIFSQIKQGNSGLFPGKSFVINTKHNVWAQGTVFLTKPPGRVLSSISSFSQTIRKCQLWPIVVKCYP